MLRVLLLVALGVGAEQPQPAPAPVPTTLNMRTGILAKLQYDLEYFTGVLALKAKGTRDTRLSKDDWDREVRRASGNVPLLKQLFSERAAYEKQGKPFTSPPRDESHRVYANLISLLNMLQAFDAQDFKRVLATGERIVVSKKEDLGQVRSEDTKYYLNLYREYFWFMAAAHYRLGNDREAIAWLSRIDSDTNVQELKKDLARVDTRSKSERLASLYGKSLAILPLVQGGPPNKELAWMGQGFAEVFTSDLYRNTNLLLMERANIDKILKEVALSQSGITDEKNAKRVATLLAAGSMIRGVYTGQGATVTVALELVDGDTGRALAQVSGTAKVDQLFADSRKLLLRLLVDAGWLAEDLAQEIAAARAPSAETIKSLLEARLLLASKSEQAKALYQKAMKDSPEYAKAFEDVKNSFKGVNPLVAVMSLASVSGRDDDGWMAQGATEALNSDLPNIGFTLSERSQLAALLKQQAVGQVLGDADSRTIGTKLGADFVVLGSVMHQGAEVRVDARFVDVTTGIVVQAFTAQGRDQDYNKVLSWLSASIARRFNVKLTDEELKKLAGNRMTRDELERMAREQLLKERLVRVEAKKEAQASSRLPLYVAGAGVVGGTALSVVGFVVSSQAAATSAYIEGLQNYATQSADQQLLSQRHAESQTAQGVWLGAGIAGAVVAMGSAGYLAWQGLKSPAEPETSLGVVAAPTFTLAPGQVGVGVSGRF